MEFQDFKIIVSDAAKKAGIGDYELYYVSKEESEVSLFNGEPTDFTASLSGGVAFRCIVGGHMGSAYTQELSPEQAESPPGQGQRPHPGKRGGGLLCRGRRGISGMQARRHARPHPG